jgi:hypothetical protein
MSKLTKGRASLWEKMDQMLLVRALLDTGVDMGVEGKKRWAKIFEVRPLVVTGVGRTAEGTGGLEARSNSIEGGPPI